MVALTAAAATSIYTVSCQTMAAQLTAAYAVQGDSIPTTGSRIHLFHSSLWNLKIVHLLYFREK
jgi:hypothetical protein